MAQPSKSSRRKELLITQSAGAVVIVSLLILMGLYLFADADPLDLFSEPTHEAAQYVQDVVTATPLVVTVPSTPNPGSEAITRWWDVFFTDPARIKDPNNLQGSIPETLIALINSAEQAIHIAAFEFNLTPVAEALIAAHRRGVQVLWLTDDDYGVEADAKEGREQFAMLLDAGIEVRYDDRGALMHDKFFIFDNAVVWTGSTNVTVNDNFRNNNNVIVLYSPEVAAIYTQEFREMWVGQLGPKSPSKVMNQSLVVDGTPLQILFSPEDNVISHLIPLVEQAQTSIRFMAFSFTHDGLEAAMEKRAAAGVDVKGIFETRGSETEFSALPKLYCAGLPMRQDGNPGTFHHKVIVIDGQIVITGSLNFSANADESNSENTVVVKNVEIAQLYLDEFDRRWLEAVDPDPAAMKCRK